MSRGRTTGIRATASLCVALLASYSHAGDDSSAGEAETRSVVRSVAESTPDSRRDLCARLAGNANVKWASVTALECVAAADDRLQKAVAERDKQGAKMFAFFVGRVVREYEGRAKFTEFRMMEIENRNLCGVVQEWTVAVAAIQEACQKATARPATPRRRRRSRSV